MLFFLSSHSFVILVVRGSFHLFNPKSCVSASINYNFQKVKKNCCLENSRLLFNGLFSILK